MKLIIANLQKKKILIPTTFGSGSEVTRISVLTVNGEKTSFHNDGMFADIAIVDPYFIKDTPRNILKNSAVDACAQCSEGYDSKSGNIYTKFLCKKAFDILKLENVSEPTPKTGEVRVKLISIGINYAEILSRKGLYGWAPHKPYILGMEGFGEIDDIGENVTGLHKGQKVIVGSQYGNYAEKIVVPANQLLKNYHSSLIHYDQEAFSLVVLTLCKL